MQDNEKEITENWLLSIGFEYVKSHMGSHYSDNLKKGKLTLWYTWNE